jgi:hypothetical protein
MKPSSKKFNLFIKILMERFDQNLHRHEHVEKDDVFKKILASEKLNSLFWMEETGGEPDVIGRDEKSGLYIFTDCAKESPVGRRSLCYDDDALQSRKENKPKGSALGLAFKAGVTVLNETQYKALQKIESFDLKTSSWILTPPEIRQKGGALFGDYRYGTTFIYHNGAESYYAARGFRCMLMV